MKRRHLLDRLIAAAFTCLIVIYLVLVFNNAEFFNWVFERHQNRLSWYIRPLFLIPFCFFAYWRSLAGIAGTIFLLLTSMCWFSKPVVVDDQVREFLQFEKDWLTQNWGLSKILLMLLVPASLAALAVSLWRRGLWLGISVIVCMALGKIVWSLTQAGESGASILVPAITGLLLCVLAVLWGFKILERKSG